MDQPGPELIDLRFPWDDGTSFEGPVVETAQIVLLTRRYELTDIDQVPTVQVALDELDRPANACPLRGLAWGAHAWVNSYSLDEGLAEVDFFLRLRLLDDAQDTLEALASRFRSDPALDLRLQRLEVATLEAML